MRTLGTLILLTVAIAALPTSSADAVDETLVKVCVLAQFEIVCGITRDASATYHCILIAPGYSQTATNFLVARLQTDFYPAIQETKCQVMGGVDANTRWWNATWLQTVRPLYCWTWGDARLNVCPTGPDSARQRATDFALCPLGFTWPGLLPTPANCSPSLPPGPPLRVPSPPWPVGAP